MNKKQLTAQVAKQTGVSQDEANKVVSAALDVITEALRKNENGWRTRIQSHLATGLGYQEYVARF